MTASWICRAEFAVPITLPKLPAVQVPLASRAEQSFTLASGALAEATGATFDDIEFEALMFYSTMAGATRAVLEAGAPAKMVVRLREELLVLCQGYAAKSVR